MVHLICNDYLESRKKFETCRLFIRGELLAIVNDNGKNENWKEYGSTDLVFGNGTRIHPVDEYRDFGAIGPIVQLVNPELLRALRLSVFVCSPEQLSSMAADYRGWVEVSFDAAPYQTSWTKGDICMMTIVAVLSEETLELVKTVADKWAHMDGKISQIQDSIWNSIPNYSE